MSYWVTLEAHGDSVRVPSHVEGGTFVMGGTTRAELNVTYNYSAVYATWEFSRRDLHGKRAAEVVPMLTMMVEQCGTDQDGNYWAPTPGKDQDGNYWAPTPGNAGHALSILLLGWALTHPDAVFRVS